MGKGVRGFVPAPKKHFNRVLQGLLVTARPGLPMTLHISSGVFVQRGVVHFVYEHTYSYSFSGSWLLPPDPTNPRKDLVVANRLNVAKIGVRPGTAAAIPFAPKPFDGEVVLAVVTIPSGTVTTTLRYWDADNSADGLREPG